VSDLAVAIIGAKGRMGQALCRLAGEEGCSVVAALDQGDDLAANLGRAKAVIDFSFHEVTPGLARLCAERGASLVVGTTGHSAEEEAVVREVSARVPVVFAPNFSVGVNALFWLAQQAARALGPDFDMEVVEMHHRLKKDAPSGTAKRLAEVVAEARGLSYAKDARHGREGLVGERGRDEIGVHAVRGGDVVGDHTVHFAAMGERVELTHRASSRDTFARGALRAARWTQGRAPGFYDMQDVLGFR
jgi:4-hydroxy-tetrahydrodipicolinate reductase